MTDLTAPVGARMNARSAGSGSARRLGTASRPKTFGCVGCTGSSGPS